MPWPAQAFAAAAAAVVAERDRWPLWLPALLGVGIGLYFAQPAEPAAGSGTLGVIVFGLLAVAWRRETAGLLLALSLTLVAGGFALAQGAAERAAAPVLQREVGPLLVRGRVVGVETVGRAQRVELDQLTLERVAAPPEKIRIKLTPKAPTVIAGDWLQVLAVLRPPSGPNLPGGFDFARQAWFQGLGGVGYAVGVAEVTHGGETAAVDRWMLSVSRLRHQVTTRITEVIGGNSGAVAAALITGERAAVSEESWDHYRDSGLAHLLAISGLHFSMVAGLVFLVVRGALALVPPVALRYPIKKWTAVVALAATAFYLLLSGATVPTQRSFAMIAIVLLAVLVDRAAISMRTVAWAATAVLLWQPQALVGASFQMSFAAVIALVAAYEAVAPRLRAWRSDGGAARGLLLYIGGIGFSTVVAGLATSLYVLYHFNRFATWSVAANLAAVPVTGLVVMPAGLLAMLLMPFGLDEAPLRVMGWGVDLVNRVAAAVSSWPAAAISLPAPPLAVLLLFTAGGLWLALWRRRWRLYGLAPMLLAGLLVPLQTPPDLLVDDSGEVVALRAADGGLLFSTLRHEAALRGDWLEGAGGGLPARGFEDAAPIDGLTCDRLGCLWRGGGQTVALIRHVAALEEDCAVATVVISARPVRQPCPSARLVIDRFDVWRDGPHAVWLRDLRAESVRAWRGERPWVPKPERRRGTERANP